MNYNEINKVYSHMRTKVYPNVQSVWKNVSTEDIIIDKYLSSVDDNRIYKLLAMPYLVKTEEFLKRYKDQCIIYYNTPNGEDGLLLFIHQISPTIHIHSRLFCWVENDVVHDHLAILVFHKNSNEAVEFIEKNFDLSRSGNTEDKAVPSGFGFK